MPRARAITPSACAIAAAIVSCFFKAQREVSGHVFLCFEVLGAVPFVQFPVTSATTVPVEIAFEDDFVAGLKNIYGEMIVFNPLLGLEITDITPSAVRGALATRPDRTGLATTATTTFTAASSAPGSRVASTRMEFLLVKREQRFK
jgi:hypothetical protein